MSMRLHNDFKTTLNRIAHGSATYSNLGSVPTKGSHSGYSVERRMQRNYDPDNIDDINILKRKYLCNGARSLCLTDQGCPDLKSCLWGQRFLKLKEKENLNG